LNIERPISASVQGNNPGSQNRGLLKPCSGILIFLSPFKHRTLVPMATKADEYRRKAREAEQQADKVSDPEAKRIYRDLAVQWQQLAIEAAKHNW
jgi:hypothetical protein